MARWLLACFGLRDVLRLDTSEGCRRQSRDGGARDAPASDS
ncbi:hypothetical protein [Agromyces sp. ZXT2-6]